MTLELTQHFPSAACLNRRESRIGPHAILLRHISGNLPIDLEKCNFFGTIPALHVALDFVEVINHEVAPFAVLEVEIDEENFFF